MQLIGWLILLGIGFALGYGLAFTQRARREERLHDSWRQRLTQAETQLRALRDDLKAARQAGARGESREEAEKLREQLMKCESERAAAVAELDRLRARHGGETRPSATSGAGSSSSSPTPGGARDDLTRIRGVGPKLAKLLNEKGITSFAQIANWSDDDIERIDAELGAFKGRIRRDDWIAQARKFMRGG